MPRRSGGGMKSSGFSRSSGPSRTARPAPSPQQSAPQAQQRPGIMSGLAGTVMQGMAFGAGSEIAHTAVRGLMGGNSHEAHEQQAPAQQVQDVCSQQNQDFLNCLQFNNNNIGACQSYLDLYKQCKGQF
ncbi:unnamed protein product [Blepharisma stoltei]|uniref:CHCH domain-containing protein n=1 Tax=Blepharisma stoltei TaxID=1481888 RepID=A0AAU9KEQ0_9CILI|nr:unnamed protein product [Blepharisma stoltei]